MDFTNVPNSFVRLQFGSSNEIVNDFLTTIQNNKSEIKSSSHINRTTKLSTQLLYSKTNCREEVINTK